ncbi:MAG: hypothetical protein GXO27_02200 [Chlorobi bacterium]|nr:hypothetical protein [Chlorobiota bacterium]
MKKGALCRPASCLAWLISIVFHPVFIPFYMLLVYFEISRYFFYDVRHILRLLFVSAVVVPVLLLLLLYKLRILRSVFLERLRARAGFTLFMAAVYYMLYRALDPIAAMHDLADYFKGIALSLVLSALFYAGGKKISLHALALGGSWMFLIRWSHTYRTEILDILAAVTLVTAVVLASRLQLRAHSLGELFWGLAVGMAGQLLVWWWV